MLKQTALYSLHQEGGAQMVEFAGWQMPLHYGSQIAEHHSVRGQVGLFDVSHMGIVDLVGRQAYDYLRFLLANDIVKLKQDGCALYTCMLNATAGVLDDLIVYRLAAEHYRVVCNASRCEQDIAWMQQQLQNFDVNLEHRDDLAMLALQGPQAAEIVSNVFSPEYAQLLQQLPRFQAISMGEVLCAHTGYTGEAGFEFMMPHQHAIDLWQQLSQIGVQCCGLGARDTLRLEAGFNLYGQDMDEDTTPLESNLAWTVCWQDKARDFIGRDVLLAQQQQGIKRRLVGLVLQPKGVLRHGQRVVTDAGDGSITSGSFSPTLEKAIALARIPQAARGEVQVERRGQLLPAIIVTPPFVRSGKAAYQQEVTHE